MIQHNIKLAIRSLRKNKLYTVVNAVGMSVGITTFILITLYINYHYSYERFNEDFARIYRVDRICELADGEHRSSESWFPIGSELKHRYPEVEEAVVSRYYGGYYVSSSEDKVFFKYRGIYAEPSFFDVFSFDFKEGSAKNALLADNSIVLSDVLANKLFPNEPALGKLVTIHTKSDYIVTGVYSTPSKPTQIIPEDFIVSMEGLNKEYSNTLGSNWDYINFQTFIKLKKSAGTDNLDAKYTSILKEFVPDKNDRIRLTPLSAIHLFGYEYDKTYVLLLVYGLLAFLALVISCVNFVNLTTALSTTRSCEIGIKKVIGSRRIGLVRQFISESVAITFIGLLLAFLLANLSLPVFNQIMLLPLTFTITDHWPLILIIIALMLVTGVLSGLYPALYLSSFNAIEAIKNPLQSGKRKNITRNWLVGFQFVLTSMIIFSTILMLDQVRYMKEKPRGFNSDNVMLTYLRADKNLSSNAGEALRSELLLINGVKDVSIAGYLPQRGYAQWEVNWEGCEPDEKMRVRTNWIGHNHFLLYDIDLVNGRHFNETMESNAPYCMINETAARQIGWEDPIGKRMLDNQYEVIGVVKDYHVSSVYEVIPPCFFLPKKCSLFEDNQFSIKLSENVDWDLIQPTVKEVFQKYVPNQIIDIIEYDVVGNDGNVALYEGIFKTFSFFATITILLSLFGLFGLVSFSLKRRTKEIGIRKSLGSNILEIFRLLVRDYIYILLIGIAFGLPLAMVFTMIDPAAYKADINWIKLSIGLLSILLVSLGSVLFHTLKAAVMNPVKALRYE